MTAGSKRQARTASLTTKVTPDELKAVEKLARQAGKNRSEWQRDLVAAALVNDGTNDIKALTTAVWNLARLLRPDRAEDIDNFAKNPQ